MKTRLSCRAVFRIIFITSAFISSPLISSPLISSSLIASLALVATPLVLAQSPGTVQAATQDDLSAQSWPQTVTTDTGSAIVYQPQIISWPNRQTLNTRIALAATPNGTATGNGTETAQMGTIEVSFTTSTNLETRWVTLSNAKLSSANFPAANAERKSQMVERIQKALAALSLKRIPLDTVLMSLNQQAEQTTQLALHNEPPKIFFSSRPASLLVFDGEPVMVPVSGTSLTFAVNTNWNVFYDADAKAWFWLNDQSWLRADNYAGPWASAGSLPPAFSSLPDNANFADVRSSVPGKTLTAADVPQVFVATVPAEIIVTEGAPELTNIPSTSLQYVANTDAALFLDSGNSEYYFLVSGRWFSSVSLEGPWTFATADLPADFANIPADGPRGFVLVSVPGTSQAQEALVQAGIPQEATLDIATTTIEVPYSGEPVFEPIANTAMTYAVNTSYNVVRVQSSYYACYRGAWFVAPVPTRGWVLAASVPAVIYTIPPSSPMYPCTYVRVYSSTPTSVTYGYTAGYTMAYVSYGVIVYGTGYYYPPVIYRGPIPIYYPYPVTYAGATYYNSATGAWAHGGAIYGPYYGARGGSAYNPQTGAYARGGSVYGPYGGAGAFSAYNPSTGSYAHGSAVWGPNGASANADWYNARTGISGSTNQNSDAYGHWGSSDISGPNQTVHTQSQGDSRGSVGSFSSSTGAEGAGARGAGGNSGGAVKTADGDVYAGADGNVYKKTDDGWQKYDDGSWNSVDKPTTDKTTAQRQASDVQSQPAQKRTDASGTSQLATAKEGAAQSGTAKSGAAEAETTQAGAAQLGTIKAGTAQIGTARANSANGRKFSQPSSQSSSQLNRDFQARQGGNQRQQQYGAARSSGRNRSDSGR